MAVGSAGPQARATFTLARWGTRCTQNEAVRRGRSHQARRLQQLVERSGGQGPFLKHLLPLVGRRIPHCRTFVTRLDGPRLKAVQA